MLAVSILISVSVLSWVVVVPSSLSLNSLWLGPPLDHRPFHQPLQCLGLRCQDIKFFSCEKGLLVWHACWESDQVILFVIPHAFEVTHNLLFLLSIITAGGYLSCNHLLMYIVIELPHELVEHCKCPSQTPENAPSATVIQCDHQIQTREGNAAS